MSEQDLLRNRVYEFRDAHQEKGKLFTVKHFQDIFSGDSTPVTLARPLRV